VAFIKAFKDVFIIGSSLGLLAAVVFLIGGWRLVPAEPLIDGQATQPVGAGEVGLD
jgi:hypothetical protein